MSQENVEVLRAAFEAWNAADTDAFRELLAPDAIMRLPAVGVGDVAGEAMTTCQSSHATDEISHPDGW